MIEFSMDASKETRLFEQSCILRGPKLTGKTMGEILALLQNIAPILDKTILRQMNIKEAAVANVANLARSRASLVASWQNHSIDQTRILMFGT